MTLYNGWKNRATWNIALWINNDEGLYNCAREFAENWKATHSHSCGLYRAFIQYMGLEHEKTLDGFQYISKHICYSELSMMMAEI